ncbi:hypothetical protein LJC59_06975 [Desulfovibrio sp. OttesenSCG-928-A18]|nr:hypothetical protein [Desulfovibrio sp. OttesenSCG-928-A18]
MNDNNLGWKADCIEMSDTIIVELKKAYDAADTIVNRLFFLRDTFRGLGSADEEAELSSYAMVGLYEILQDMLNKTQDVVETLGHIRRRAQVGE